MKKTRIISTKFRWFINIFLMIAMLIAIIFGSIFYLKPKLSTNTDSNIKSIKSTLKISKSTNDNLTNKKTLSDKEVLRKTKAYLQNKNLLSTYDLSITGKNQISLTDYTSKNDVQKNRLINSLTKKPYLTFTYENGDPVFYKGKFQSWYDPNRKRLKDFMEGDPADFMPELEENPAFSYNSQGYSRRVGLKFTENGWKEYIKYGNEAYYRYTRHGIGPSSAYIWTNLKEYINWLKENDPETYKKYNGNPVKSAFADGRTAPEEEKTKDKNGKTNNKNDKNVKKSKINPYLKESAAKYLISSTHPLAMVPQNSAVNSYINIFNENKAGYTDAELAAAINYSMAPFDLTLEYSYYETTNFSNVNRYLIVLSILYALFSVFLIIRYRLYGLVSIITLAFFLFILLTIIAALNIFISPIIALTIIVSFVLAFELIHNLLDSFKKEIQDGANTTKAISKIIKTALIPSLDSIFSIIVLSIFAIYLNTLYSTPIGIILFTSIVINFAIAVIMQYLIMRNWAKTESFDKNYHLVLWNGKYSQKIYKTDLISKSKYFSIGFASLIVLAFVMYFIYAGINQSWKNGLNLSSEFKGGYTYLFSPTEGNYFNKTEINEVIKFLNSHSGELGKFNANSVLYSNEVNKENYGLLLKSQNDILSSLEQLKNLNPVLQKMILNSSKIQPISLTSDILTISIIIFASLLIIAAYMTLRYSLISGIILFLKSLFAIVFTLSLILITKAKISTNLLDSLILSTMFIINDSIINSSKIKFEFTKDVNTKNYIFDKAKISEIFRTNIIQILSRQLTNLTTWIIFIPLTLYLMNSLNSSFVYSISYALIMLSFINIFLIPNIWRSIVVLKYKLKQKRIEKGYWLSKSSVEEQSFIGINEYSI